ncbi:UNVERIFIED_CONTAM: hypothetical protein Slati_1768000 [Sesamum latifolium]|uniref:Uncharacterized protein n=1 Tax=Sesamum latifolium TaxID=2727402 RepID=A0AAW2X006_9LAMI
MLAQYKGMVKKSKLVLIGQASTSKSKVKKARWTKKENCKAPVVGEQVKGKAKGMRKKVAKKQQTEDECNYFHENRHWKRNYPKYISSLRGRLVDEVNMVANSTSLVLKTHCGAHIYNDL